MIREAIEEAGITVDEFINNLDNIYIELNKTEAPGVPCIKSLHPICPSCIPPCSMGYPCPNDYPPVT